MTVENTVNMRARKAGERGKMEDGWCKEGGRRREG